MDRFGDLIDVGLGAHDVGLDGIDNTKGADKSIDFMIQTALVLPNEFHVTLHMLILGNDEGIRLLEEVHPVLMG